MIKKNSICNSREEKSSVSVCFKVFFLSLSPLLLSTVTAEKMQAISLIFKHVPLDLNFWTACLLAVFLLQAVLSH